MRDTSFAEESPVEGACDLLDFDGEAAIRSRGERDRRRRVVGGARLAGPVVPDAVVAMDAAAVPGVWPVDVRGHAAQDRVDVPGVECLTCGPRQILSFHCWNVPQLLVCAARALEARTAVQRRGSRAVRSFPCGRAGDSCESCRAQPHAAADDPCRAAWSGQPPAQNGALRCLVRLPFSNEGEVD